MHTMCSLFAALWLVIKRLTHVIKDENGTAANFSIVLLPAKLAFIYYGLTFTCVL